MFSKFGRQIFKLYETRPLLMNSIVGGGVYVAGECTVQTQSKDVRFFTWENYSKLGQLGALGSVENGLVMMKWYGFLNKFIGSSVSTNIVLLKCVLDQLFFATQQDLLFLGLCAYNDSVEISDAVQEVKDTFLTTWIVDCSLWPVVNFVGFAFVPVVLQPTYMAFVSYFWQLYMSNAASKEIEEVCDAELEALFRELDTDNSQYIDATELHTYFARRGVIVTHAEVRQMIADADQVGRGIQVEEGTPDEQICDDGQVSLEEFKRLATHGDTLQLKTNALWASVRQDISLSYGSKHAMKRLQTMQAHTPAVASPLPQRSEQSGVRSASSSEEGSVGCGDVPVVQVGSEGSMVVSGVISIGSAESSSSTSVGSSIMEGVSNSGTNSASVGTGTTNTKKGTALPTDTHTHTPTTNTTPTHAITESIKHTLAKPVPVHPPVHTNNTNNNTANTTTVANNTTNSSNTNTNTTNNTTTSTNTDDITTQDIEKERILAMSENRTAAVNKASIGGAILMVAVIIRKVVFKL